MVSLWFPGKNETASHIWILHSAWHSSVLSPAGSTLREKFCYSDWSYPFVQHFPGVRSHSICCTRCYAIFHLDVTPLVSGKHFFMGSFLSWLSQLSSCNHTPTSKYPEHCNFTSRGLGREPPDISKTSQNGDFINIVVSAVGWTAFLCRFALSVPAASNDVLGFFLACDHVWLLLLSQVVKHTLRLCEVTAVHRESLYVSSRHGSADSTYLFTTGLGD